MDPKDNVVTCVRDVKKGETVVYRKNGKEMGVKAEMDIPYCHKIALCDLKKEDVVLKYGEMIGRLTEDVRKGHLIDHNNLYSVPRDYDSEMI